MKRGTLLDCAPNPEDYASRTTASRATGTVAATMNEAVASGEITRAISAGTTVAIIHRDEVRSPKSITRQRVTTATPTATTTKYTATQVASSTTALWIRLPRHGRRSCRSTVHSRAQARTALGKWNTMTPHAVWQSSCERGTSTDSEHHGSFGFFRLNSLRPGDVNPLTAIRQRTQNSSFIFTRDDGHSRSFLLDTGATWLTHLYWRRANTSWLIAHRNGP